MMGLAFFQSGIETVRSGEFDASFSLTNVVPDNGSPAADQFVAMGETDSFVEFLTVAVPGEVLLGLDPSLESYDVGGQPLTERYPGFRYVLGYPTPADGRS